MGKGAKFLCSQTSIKENRPEEELERPDHDLENGKGDSNNNREKWSNPIDYMMACLALCVGFGSKYTQLVI